MNMEHKILETKINIFHFTELDPEIQVLINKAKGQVHQAYAPYSNFFVGAAVLLENGALFVGNNQENAAFPAGLCAERVALFYANAQFPNVPVRAIAIAAYTHGEFVDNPISPCGACRQVMLEAENRFEKSIDLYMYGNKHIYHIESVRSFLPLSFDMRKFKDE
jgi:cytidine deaminase